MTKPRPTTAPRGPISAPGGIKLRGNMWLFCNDGVPVNGTSGTGAGWAGPGAKCFDVVNGIEYINQGTAASPIWVAAGGSGGLNNIVEDLTPQLGGNLDVNGKVIASAANGPITITPNGAGDLILDGLKWPQADGTANYVLKTNGAGQLSWVAQNVSGITDVVQDLTPQLGGNLDVNGKTITSVSNNNISIIPSGTGNVALGVFNFNADQSVGAGQDNYVLTYDNASGLINLEAAAGGSGATFHGFSAQLSGTQTITNDIFTKLQLAVESYDTDNNFDSVTNFRHTPTTAGKWTYIIRVGSGNRGTATRLEVSVDKNGAGVQAPGSAELTQAASSTDVSVMAVTQITMNGSTDFVEFSFRHNNASTIDLQPGELFTSVMGFLYT